MLTPTSIHAHLTKDLGTGAAARADEWGQWRTVRRSEVLDVEVHMQPRRCLSAASHLQFLQDIMHVVLDRGGTDRQLARNVLV